METKDERSEVLILAAGDYPTRPELRALLHESQRVICCDSAAETFFQHEGRWPWCIVGDLDSLSVATDEVTCPVVHFSEQETNDLSKAVRHAASQGFKRITILGATGRREDHTLGNIALLMDYKRQGLEIRMHTNYGTFTPCINTYQAELPLGTQLSVFSFGAQDLRAIGLRYPLYDFTSWWQGTLNEVIAREVEISAQGGFLVYVAHYN